MKEVWGGETHVCSEADAKNVFGYRIRFVFYH